MALGSARVKYTEIELSYHYIQEVNMLRIMSALIVLLLSPIAHGADTFLVCTKRGDNCDSSMGVSCNRAFKIDNKNKKIFISINIEREDYMELEVESWTGSGIVAKDGAIGYGDGISGYTSYTFNRYTGMMLDRPYYVYEDGKEVDSATLKRLEQERIKAGFGIFALMSERTLEWDCKEAKAKF